MADDPAPVDPAPVDPAPVDPAPADPAPVDWKEGLSEQATALVGESETLEEALMALAPKDPPAPEEYELPEGYEAFGAFANENRLSKDQVKSLLEFQQNASEQQATAFAEAQQAATDKLFDQWGDNKDANISLAKRAIRHFDEDGQILNILNETGMGNDARVISLFYRIGESLKEDGYIDDDHQPPASRDDASVLFPTMEN